MAFGRRGVGSRFGAPLGPRGVDEPLEDDMGGGGGMGMSAAPSDDLVSPSSGPQMPPTTPALPAAMPVPLPRMLTRRGGSRGRGLGRGFPKRTFSAGAKHRPSQFFGE